jgi:hypothetical protein
MTMDVSKIGWEGMNWMPLVQGSDQWQAPVNITISFPGKTLLHEVS